MRQLRQTNGEHHYRRALAAPASPPRAGMQTFRAVLSVARRDGFNDWALGSVEAVVTELVGYTLDRYQGRYRRVRAVIWHVPLRAGRPWWRCHRVS